MSDDLLERAARALRDTTDGPTAADEERYQRIRQDVSRARRRTHLSRLVAMPLVAAVLVTVTWAGASGRLSGIASALSRIVRSDPPAASVDTSLSRPPERSVENPLPSEPSRVPELPEAPLKAASPSATAVAPALPSPGTVHPPAPGSSARLGAPRLDAPEASPAAAPDFDALYQEAHHAHFIEQNPARALAAWDRYLAAGPKGQFFLEARYNRAISLFRIGRRADAAAALQPFADGDYGSYRREEAKALLESLGVGGER